MRAKLAISQILQPIWSRNNIQLPIPIQIVSNHLLAVLNVRDNPFRPGLFWILGNFEQLWRMCPVVVSADQGDASAWKQRRYRVAVRPVSITAADHVLFPLIAACAVSFSQTRSLESAL